MKTIHYASASTLKKREVEGDDLGLSRVGYARSSVMRKRSHREKLRGLLSRISSLQASKSKHARKKKHLRKRKTAGMEFGGFGTDINRKAFGGSGVNRKMFSGFGGSRKKGIFE